MMQGRGEHKVTHRDEVKAIEITRQIFEVSDSRHCGLDDGLIVCFRK